MRDARESVTVDRLADHGENWEDYVDWEASSQLQSDSDQNGIIVDFCLASYGSLNAARQS